MIKRIPKEAGKNVRFELSAEPGSEVFVAGTFNKWNPTKNPLKDSQADGHYKAAMRVPIGTHEYKFVVDGVWAMDQKCTEWSPNGCGSLNSVLHA